MTRNAMKSAPATAATAAADAVREARGILARWETTRQEAAAALAELQSGVGAEALADPQAALALPRQMQEQRDRIEIADRALDAQRSRVAAAESEYLLAEADLLERAVAAAAAALEQHEARTAELLRALEAHEGRYVPESEIAEFDSGALVRDGRVEYTMPRSRILRAELETAEKRVWILREMAAGRDPHPALRAQLSIVDGKWWGTGITLEELYPACVWGPDALVTAPAYDPAAAVATIV